MADRLLTDCVCPCWLEWIFCLGFLAEVFRLGRHHAPCIRAEVVCADVGTASKAVLMTVLETLRLVALQDSWR